MEYFKSGLKSVLGAPVVEDQPSGADIVRFYIVENCLRLLILHCFRDTYR